MVSRQGPRLFFRFSLRISSVLPVSAGVCASRLFCTTTKHTSQVERKQNGQWCQHGDLLLQYRDASSVLDHDDTTNTHQTPKALSALSKHKWLFADPLLLLSRHASVASISEIYCVGPCLQQSLPRRPQPHPNPGSCDPLAGCPFHSGTLENTLRG